MTLTPGSMLQNRYRIVSLLGQGGMGAVYKAWDTRLDVPVALKEMTPQPGLDDQALDKLRLQFQQEAKILARMNHPHLVRVGDFFEEEGNTYLVMDFVEGESLADCIEREGAVAESQVLEWASQLVDALGYCHSQGVIHRDIKPHNVIIRPDGQAVLVDFGLVKLWDPTDPHTKTVMRGMGTPEYAPPEQYDMQVGHTDPRSDIYSLGATLYHTLTGQAPPTATQRMVDPSSLKAPTALNPSLSSNIERSVLKAVEPQPGQRFQNTQEMAAALAGKAPASIQVAPAREQRTKVLPQAQPAAPARRRVPGWAKALVGIAALILVGVVVAAVIGNRQGAEPGPTEAAAVATKRPTEPPAQEPAAVPTKEPTKPPTDTPRPTEAPTQEPTEQPAAVPLEAVFRAGMVTDVGGIDDKSFNATAWKGMEMAQEELGVEVAYLESQQQTDYAVNITQFLDQDYDMIVTIGFLLGDDTATFAEQNPDTNFAIVDFGYDPVIPNVLGLQFAIDEATFLAGYLAAGMSQTGKVGTFGGIAIPPVTDFMIGLKAGVDYYNRRHGTNVQVLGMDLFVGNFESTDDGRRTGEDLIAEGADIIMPVAGPVGLGTAAAIQENPGTMLIGVDDDWCVSAAEYCNVTLTSVMKNMDVAVRDAIKAGVDGTFEGGFWVGTLSNGGVGIAGFHDFDDDVPDDLKAELEEVQRQLISGAISAD